MKYSIFVIVIFFTWGSLSFSQRKILPEIAINTTGSYLGYSDAGLYSNFYHNGYLGFLFSAGARLSRSNNRSIFLYGSYLHNSTKLINYFNEPFYRFQLLGLGTEFRFREDKKVRWFIRFDFATQVHTNYKDGYLDPQFNAVNISHYYGPFAGDHSPYNKIEKYKGTPLVDRLTCGINTNFFKILKFNVGLGFGSRLIRYQKVTLMYVNNPLGFHSANEYSLIGTTEEHDTNYRMFYMLEFQMGISYTIPVKKNTKML